MCKLFDRLQNAAIHTWSFHLVEKNRERNFDFKIAGHLYDRFVRIRLILRKRYKIGIKLDRNDRLVFIDSKTSTDT